MFLEPHSEQEKNDSVDLKPEIAQNIWIGKSITRVLFVS